MTLIFSTLVFLGAFLTIYVAYWLFLLIAHVVLPERVVRRHDPMTKIAIVIPAHNEELLLQKLIESASSQDYPHELFSIIVVADNCTDNTVDVARQNGAIVLERADIENRGKGYAIKWALETINMDQYNAVFIIDSDSVMSSKVLLHLDGMIQEGKRVIQCYNGIANPDDSWFTRLLDVSRTIGNEIYHPAKQKLGLSSYLMGNGMCFTNDILQKYGWDAFTVGEDWEHYAKLVQNGESVSFARDARVYHRESASLKQATSQRMRWSSGRFAIAWRYGFRLLHTGLRERNIVKLDAALPLVFPNPSLGMNITLVGLAASVALPVYKSVLTAWFLILCVMQTGTFVLGIFHTRNKLSKFMSLFIAPIFLLWKMGIDALSALGMGRKKWVRTERKL
ncbi:MAG: glycosyltransferase family 2 protein [Gammaproteobacteria bacterium]